jgi:hypothetical protein
MTMRILTPLCLVGLLALAACDKPAHENNLFPLVKGKSWTYQIETVYDEPDTKTVKSTLEIRNLGSAELSDGSTAWRRRTDMGHEYWLQSTDQEIARVAMKAPLKERAIMDEEVRTVLPHTLNVGTTWTTTTVPYVLRRRNEKPADFRYLPKYQNLPMVFTVLALDAKVDTPADKFENCALVEGKLEILLWNDEAFAYKPNHLVQKEWYCPGVGLVQVERVEPTTTKLLQGGVMRMRLLQSN